MKLKRRYLPEGEELGVHWERYADGHPWRLKRKRDFGDVNPQLAREAAVNAAARMGKAVQAVKDRRFPEKYMWVQFADHEIGLGEPCPCGSRKLLRLHTYFARCPACHALLLLSKSSVALAEGDEDEQPEEESEAPAGQAATLLEQLEDVRLSRIRRSGEREVYRGYGIRGGTLVMVIAEFAAAPNEPLDPEEALDRAADVHVVPMSQLEDLLDTSILVGRDEAEWDLVL